MTIEEWHDTHGSPTTINSKTLDNIYGYLWNLSNRVGDTITEYDWRECCILMLQIDEEDEEAAEIRNQWIHRYYTNIRSTPSIQVEAQNILENVEGYDFHF